MSQPVVDPTFYRTAADAGAAPAEKLAYVAAFDPTRNRPDAMLVVDVDPTSPDYGTVVGSLEVGEPGEELHHYGWNACSSAWMHEGHDMSGLQRRYLVVPGIRSSNIHILDTQPDPRNPVLHKIVSARELAEKAGYSRPHTVHCGPKGIFVTCLGSTDVSGQTGPAGIALLDHDTFEVIGPWEQDRGPQQFSYDAWWHLTSNVLISSEWGTPSMFENGLIAEKLLANEYGHSIHIWDLAGGKHLQELDLGAHNQLAFEVRPAHDPDATWGYVGVVLSTEDLSASVFRWYKDGHEWKTEKVISIPARPADPDLLPPFLKPFSAVPPLISDIDISVDDRFLYVACFGTGELKQYDITDPSHPREVSTVSLGGIGRRTPHPALPDTELCGGPQMVEVSRDGTRVFFTNSLYSAVDDQFFPEGVGAWMAMANVDPETGIMSLDERFFLHGEEHFGDRRVHQIRLQGGDASSDSYCFR